MQRSTYIVRKQTKYQRQCVLFWEMWPHNSCSFTSRKKVKWLLYSPLFFRATTGQITTSPLKVRIKLSKNCEALWVGMSGWWEFKVVCLFGGGGGWVDGCVQVFANISANIPIVVYIRSCKLRFDAQSSVCSGNLVLLTAHTYTHTLTDLWAGTLSLPLSVSSLPSVVWERLIRQSGRESWINKWISWHVQAHFVTVLIWPADSQGEEHLSWPQRLSLIDG